MMEIVFECVECGVSIPTSTVGLGILPERGYVVGHVYRELAGVLHRDEFGMTASYAGGRPESMLVRRGCTRAECSEHRQATEGALK